MLTVLGLISVVVGMIISVGSVIRLWIAAQTAGEVLKFGGVGSAAGQQISQAPLVVQISHRHIDDVSGIATPLRQDNVFAQPYE